MEKPIEFASGELLLEGFLNPVSEKGVIVTHPHPLYGGNMYNPVVESVASVFSAHEFSTLRFNFRGVGLSQGSYEDGKGELRDVKNAFAYLKQNGIGTIYLAGYSFGAWVNAHVSRKQADYAGMVMVSPPVAFMDFAFLKATPELRLVVTGSRDNIAPPGQIEKLCPFWNPAAAVEIISGADHFYSGYLDELERVIEVHMGSIETPGS